MTDLDDIQTTTQANGLAADGGEPVVGGSGWSCRSFQAHISVALVRCTAAGGSTDCKGI